MSGVGDLDPTEADVRRVIDEEENVKTVRALSNALDVSQVEARKLAIEAGVYGLLGDYSRDRVRGDVW